VTSVPVERVLTALLERGGEPKQSGKGWSCRCPAHADATPSLSVAIGDDGRALLKCHAGCTAEQIVAALDLTMRDLMSDKARTSSGRSRPKPVRSKATTKSAPVNSQRGDMYATAEAAIAALSRSRGAPQAIWTYVDAAGLAVGKVLRWNLSNGKKKYLPVARYGDRWACKGMPEPRPLYRLDEISKLPPGTRVYVVEGEKCADILRDRGLVATTSAHGSGSAHQTDWSPLSRMEVVILPDNDDAGEKYAAEVKGLVSLVGADSVRITRLPDLPEKGDVEQFVEICNHDRDKACEQIQRLADSTSPERASKLGPKFIFKPISAFDLIRQYPGLRPCVIEGLLREGEVMNFVAAPKVGKTWLAHSLAGAVAAGQPWFGMATKQGQVLIIDAELHLETLASRMDAMQKALGLSDEDMRLRVQVQPVRGERLKIDELDEVLASVPSGTYRVILIDALYRFLPVEGEENSNETMTRVYNAVDALAKRLRSAIVLVHHTSKGDQRNKSVTDIGSGGGAQSRAADTHVVMRPHKVDGAVVVEAAVRSWKPLVPFVIRWNNPGWVLAPELDPKDILKPNSGRTKKQTEAQEPGANLKLTSYSPESFADEIVGSKPDIRENIIARGKDKGLSNKQSEDLLKRAEDAGCVQRHVGNHNSAHRFSNQPVNQLRLVGGDGGGGEGADGPHPPVLAAHGGCGGDRAPPLTPSQPSPNGNTSPTKQARTGKRGTT
jgi:hypothetical protein